MKLVELGARFMDFVDLEFLELRCLAGKKWSGAVFLNLEQFGAAVSCIFYHVKLSWQSQLNL
jgi:hypothetical protein